MEKISVGFWDNESQEAKEHQVSQEEIEKLFKIAEKLTENDLKKLERACKAINNPKIS